MLSSLAASAVFRDFVAGWCDEDVAGEVVAGELCECCVKPDTDIVTACSGWEKSPRKEPKVKEYQRSLSGYG